MLTATTIATASDAHNPPKSAEPPVDGSAYAATMRNSMVRFLRKRKFRLVTRWKAALKENIRQPHSPPDEFPYTIIFRAFDEVIDLLKLESPPPPSAARASFLEMLDDNHPPTADQFMELFLSGRDVFAEFCTTDTALSNAFAEEERQDLHAGCERAFKHLIEREMPEFTRRFTADIPR